MMTAKSLQKTSAKEDGMEDSKKTSAKESKEKTKKTTARYWLTNSGAFLSRWSCILLDWLQPEQHQNHDLGWKAHQDPCLSLEEAF
jgi:hypothetical protein